MAQYKISYQLTDADANKNTVMFRIPAGSLTLAQVQEYADEFGTLLDAVTDAQITGVAVELSAAVNGAWKAAPVAGSNNQEGGLMQYSAASTEYVYSIRVPAWKQSFFSGKSILNSGAAGTFITGITAGLDASGTTVQQCDRNENDLTAYLSGVKSFRRK